MADELKLKAPTLEEIGVNFPFLISLQHPVLDLHGMFRVTQAFDMYEMERDPDAKAELVKEKIVVDVLEITPEVTTIKVTPAQTMPYQDLFHHVDSMLQELSKRLFKAKLRVIRLTWELDKTGVSSDLRGMLRKVS